MGHTEERTRWMSSMRGDNPPPLGVTEESKIVPWLFSWNLSMLPAAFSSISRVNMKKWETQILPKNSSETQIGYKQQVDICHRNQRKVGTWHLHPQQVSRTAQLLARSNLWPHSKISNNSVSTNGYIFKWYNRLTKANYKYKISTLGDKASIGNSEKWHRCWY